MPVPDLGLLLFLGLFMLIIASAFMVATSPNLVHSAVSLLFTLFGISAIYIYLYADFIAATQVVIYVGGILVLIIFGVMLTNRVSNTTLIISSINQFVSGILCFAFFLINLVVIYSSNWKIDQNLKPVEGTTATIGEMLLIDYLLPFEVASLLLLGALISATTLSRKDD